MQRMRPISYFSIVMMLSSQIISALVLYSERWVIIPAINMRFIYPIQIFWPYFLLCCSCLLFAYWLYVGTKIFYLCFLIVSIFVTLYSFIMLRDYSYLIAIHSFMISISTGLLTIHSNFSKIEKESR